MASERPQRAFGEPRDAADMLVRLRLGAWPLAVLAIVLVLYLQQLGGLTGPAAPLAVVLLGAASWTSQSPSRSSLLSGLLAAVAASAWVLWRLQEPWTFPERIAENRILPVQTIRLLPAVFAAGATIQLGWLLSLWQRFPRLRPRDPG